MAEVNLGGIISMGTLQNLVRALTIPTDSLGPLAKNMPGGIAQAISDPLRQWADLLEKHVGEVESQPRAMADTLKKAALELAGTGRSTVGALQQFDAELLRNYAEAARAFLQAVDPILKEMDEKPDLVQGAVEDGVEAIGEGLSPTLENVQNVYAQSVRSFANALKLVAGAVPAATAAVTNAAAPGTSAVAEKIDIA
jgi:hypothetical protein